MISFFPLLRRFTVTLLALGLLMPLAALADSADADLDAANRAYTDGHYDEAAGLFQKLVDTRGYSASLCFDLGNAYEKAGHPGLAILNYERARYLAPGDRDIDHNLQLARQQAGLQPNSYRWWEVALRLIYPVVGYLVIGCLLLLVLAVAGHLYTAGNKAAFPGVRLACKVIFFTIIPVGLFLGFAELCATGFTSRIDGVIVAKEATLRLSPFDSAERTGSIPEGELVTVERHHDDYYWIEARDHHFGWVEQKEIEPVIAGSF
jgi:hypothetical protein